MNLIMNIDKVINIIYEGQVSDIREKNIELERENFTILKSLISTNNPNQDTSYEDYIAYLKAAISYAHEFGISQTYTILKDCFFFSAHDIIFRKKLEADIFTSVPMDDFIYPKIKYAVKQKYSDVSIMTENPNYDDNMQGISKIIHTYIELNSLLYLLYCNDFHFPECWEKLYPEHEEIINILDNFEITIGDFLHALINDKCKIMEEILSNISDPEIRNAYLNELQEFKESKHQETETFSHVKLPATYFLTHKFADFLNGVDVSSTQKGNKSNILIPKN